MTFLDAGDGIEKAVCFYQFFHPYF